MDTMFGIVSILHIINTRERAKATTERACADTTDMISFRK